MKEEELNQTIQDIVDCTLPEFGRCPVALTIGSEYDPNGARMLRYTRRRVDSLYEALVFQKDFYKRDALVSLQVVVHYFPACPIPAFPFGSDGGLANLTSGKWMTPVMDSWHNCGRRYDSAIEKLSNMLDQIRAVVRPNLDFWAEQLLADPVLLKALQLAAKWPVQNEDSKPFVMDELETAAKVAPESRTATALPRVFSELRQWKLKEKEDQRCESGPRD